MGLSLTVLLAYKSISDFTNTPNTIASLMVFVGTCNLGFCGFIFFLKYTKTHNQLIEELEKKIEKENLKQTI